MEMSKFEDKILLEPYNYLMSNCGKEFRNKLIQSFNYWLNISDERLNLIKEVICLLHNSSLLIDDIEDNSELRRGQPVAHNVYGLGLTLNCANYCYFIALQKLIEGVPADKLISAVTIFNEHILGLHRGQGLDIYWRDNMICPNEEEYLKMIDLKTGALFGLAIKLMQLFSDCVYNFDELLIYLGQYFQIRDDYANLVSNEYIQNKSFAEDLSEGKFSFPVIHAIQSNLTDTVIQDIIKKRTNNESLKRIAIKKMEEFGSFKYTIDRIKQLDSRVEQLIDSLGGNPILSKLLDVLRNVE